MSMDKIWDKLDRNIPVRNTRNFHWFFSIFFSPFATTNRWWWILVWSSSILDNWIDCQYDIVSFVDDWLSSYLTWRTNEIIRMRTTLKNKDLSSNDDDDDNMVLMFLISLCSLQRKRNAKNDGVDYLKWKIFLLILINRKSW